MQHETNTKTWGAALREARTAAQLTATMLSAKLSPKDRSCVMRWEHGGSIKRAQLEKLYQVLPAMKKVPSPPIFEQRWAVKMAARAAADPTIIKCVKAIETKGPLAPRDIALATGLKGEVLKLALMRARHTGVLHSVGWATKATWHLGPKTKTAGNGAPPKPAKKTANGHAISRIGVLRGHAASRTLVNDMIELLKQPGLSDRLKMFLRDKLADYVDEHKVPARAVLDALDIG